MTDTTPARVQEIRELAIDWLARQKATKADDLLDEGDCRFCGRPSGYGHEPTDPCGIVSDLLDLLASLQAEHERLMAIAGLVNGWHNGLRPTKPSAADVLRQIADALGEPMVYAPETRKEPANG